MTLYTLILNIHIVTAGSLIALVIHSDHLGWGWMRGKYQVLPAPKLKLLHHSVYGGLVVMILTGLYMFWPLQSYLLTNGAFLVKMALLLTLLVNSFFVGRLAKLSTEKPFNLLNQKERVPLYISGAVSTVCWLAIIVAAKNIGL